MMNLCRRCQGRGLTSLLRKTVRSGPSVSRDASRALRWRSARDISSLCHIAKPVHTLFDRVTTRGFASEFGGQDIELELLEGATNIMGYTENGIIVNNIIMQGSVIALPTFAALWDVDRVEDITTENISLVTHIQPPIEYLLLGCGERISYNVSKEVREFLKSKGVVLETMDSFTAISTFNILNAEGRRVAAAILTAEPNARTPHTGPYD